MTVKWASQNEGCGCVDGSEAGQVEISLQLERERSDLQKRCKFYGKFCAVFHLSRFTPPFFHFAPLYYISESFNLSIHTTFLLIFFFLAQGCCSKTTICFCLSFSFLLDSRILISSPTQRHQAICDQHNDFLNGLHYVSPSSSCHCQTSHRR